MKRRCIVPVLLLLLCFLSSSVSADTRHPAAQKHFFWKVVSGRGTVFLLGSIHYSKKDLYPLPGVMEDAFRKSGTLAVEANIDDIGRIDMQKLMDRALYPEGDSLEEHVSPETFADLRKELDGYGIPPAFVDRQRPWFVALTLTSLELLASGFDPDLGIDRHFLSEAKGKKIVELESVDYQIDLLSSFSDADQELFLRYTLRDLHLVNKEGEELLKAWRTGDTKMMESLVFRDDSTDRGMSGIYEKLLYERNRNMAAGIENLLKAQETCFVVVGAAHLIGEKGVVGILIKKGYAVTQM